MSQEQAGDLLNVTRRSVQRAAEVISTAQPEIVRAVDQGHLAVSAAAQAAKLDPAQQRRIASAATPRS